MAKITSMLGDALSSLFKPPATEKYPLVKNDAPTRFRGLLKWDQEACIGCGICQKVCPAEAVEMIVLDRTAKKYVMRYHVDRCTFCAQCVVSCPKACLELDSNDWENAALNRDGFTLVWGSEEDVQQVLNAGSEPDATPGE